MSTQDTEMKMKSLHFASLGIQKMNMKDYTAAANFFTLAIQKFSNDANYFVYRSTCYSLVGQFGNAMDDANQALKINSNLVLGHVAKGGALIGLSKFGDAEIALKEAKKLDPEIDVASKFILVREGYLRELGFNEEIVQTYSKNFGTIDEALTAASDDAVKKILTGDNLLSNLANLGLGHGGEDEDARSSRTESRRIPERPLSQLSANASGPVSDKSPARPIEPGSYVNDRSVAQSEKPRRISDTESVSTYQESGTSAQIRNSPAKHVSDSLQDIKACHRIKPVNIYGFTGVAVSNVYPKVAHKKLVNVFSEYGDVKRVQIIEKNNIATAIVMFDDTEAPRAAIRDIQGTVIREVSNCGAKLRMRFAPGYGQNEKHMKSFGRVNGTECFYWRTTKCTFRDCPKIHEPICRGIDWQTWML